MPFGSLEKRKETWKSMLEFLAQLPMSGALQPLNQILPKKTVYDAQDLIVPAEENGAFFVITNPITTNNQQRGECAEDRRVEDAICTDDADCVAGHVYLDGHGVSNGTCNESAGTRTCIIQAWCPLEHDSAVDASDNVLDGISDLRVSIKNYVYFPHFKKAVTNTKKAECEYDEHDHPNCAVFKLGYMIERALEIEGLQDKTDAFDQLKKNGGVISINIIWNCDYDHSHPLSKCNPKYEFNRLDTGENDNAQGYHVRHTNVYFNSNGVETRQLITAYGILFIIRVDARATDKNDGDGFIAFGSSLGYAGFIIIGMGILAGCCHKRKAKVCDETNRLLSSQ